MIALSTPLLTGNEFKYIKDCLDTTWVSTSGKYINLFEKKICEYTKAKYAIACINGTSALQVSLRVVGVRTGDEVIVPTLTFIAPVNAIRYLNAEPIFMDCDDYYNIDIEKTVCFIKEQTRFQNGFSYNSVTGRRITAIIPVHVFGNAVELEPLVEVCRERNIKIVEDAAESLGTFYNRGKLKGRYTGTIGDMGCYSFNGNKIITSGGGGMIIADSAPYAEKARYLTTQAKDDEFRYIHNEIGYNFRLSNIPAAIGVAQLERLPEFLEIKKRNYLHYKTGIAKIRGLRVADTPSYAESNYWFYCLQIEKHSYGKDREELRRYLAQQGIETRPVWYLNHLQRPYQDCQSYSIQKAFELLDKTLSLPCGVNLTPEKINKIIGNLQNG